jgi:ketosteroid isomerase-like protein
MDTPLVDRLRRLAAELTGIADHVATPAPSSDDAAALAEQLATRFLDAVERGELDDLDDLVHHDVVHVVPGRSRAAGVYEGPDAIRRAMSVLPRAGIHDLRAKLVDLVATPTQVVTFHELSGTVDGRPHTIELMLRFALRDGRIARVTEYTTDQYATDDIFG